MGQEIDRDMESIRLANSHSNRAASNLIANSVGSSGAEPCTYEQKYERVPKRKFKRKIKDFLVIMLLLISLLAVGFKVVDVGIRKIELHNANKYMSYRIVSHLEKCDVDYSLTDGSKITILETDEVKLSNLCDALEKDGFTREESFYTIFKTCGEDSSDKVVTTAGYRDTYNFISKNYDTNDAFSDIYNRFENNVEVGYVENVERIQEVEKQKLEQGKGMGL